MSRSKDYEMAIKIAGKVEQSFKNSMGLTERQLKAIAREAAKTEKATKSSLGSSFDKANKTVESFSNGAKKALKAVAKAAAVTGTAAAGIGAAATKVGADFEAQMSTVKAISGATENQFIKLTDKAKDIGENTAFSAKEAGEAMEYMAMAGWKTKDMLNGIDGVMNLAAASGEDLGAVSDIVTDAMTAFGMAADGMTNGVANATYFSDILAKTAASANTNVGLMGETFKYVASVAGSLGYNIKDTSVAIGLMANSGIKASNAGTSLRSWLSRMASPTKAVTASMERLGISLTDQKGNMYSLMEILENTRKSFSGLSKSEKAAEASALAGKQGMSGLLAIVNASDKDFAKLTKEIDNASGAAKEMADIKLDNLKGDSTLFVSAAQGLGIEAYDQMKSQLRQTVQLGTEGVSALTKYLSKSKIIEKGSKMFGNALSDISKQAPTTIRELQDLTGSIKEFSSPFFDLAKWIIAHPKIITSELTGIGAAIVSFKIASKVKDVATAFGGLATVLTNPFAVAILGVGAAIGGAAGLATYIKICENEAKKQNLAQHFGTISLSLEELQDVANRILDDGSLTKLNTALEEFSKVDSIAEEIQDTVKSVNKMNWKVSVGLKLSKSEKQQYKSDIASYIEQTQNLVSQERYALALNIKLLTGDENSSIGNSLDNFLAGKQTELEKLGKKLQKTVNKAFDDGLLTVDEEKKIQQIQKQMQDISDGISQSNFNADMEVISKQYSGGNLTPDSFKNLQKELSSKVTEAEKNYKESLQKSIAALNYQLSQGDISQTEYDSGVDKLWDGYRKKVGEAESKAAEFSLNTIMGQYNDELKDASSSFDKIMQDYMSRETDWTSSAGLMWDGFVEQFDGKMLDSSTRNAIKDLLKQLEPTEEQLQEVADQYTKAGEKIPTAISEGLQQIEMLKMFSGDETAIWNAIQKKLLEDGEYTELLNKINAAGGYIPKEIKAGMQAKAAENAKQGASYVRKTTGNALQNEFKSSFDVGLRINTNNETTKSVIRTQVSNARSLFNNFLGTKFEAPFSVAAKIKASVSNTGGAAVKPAHNAKGSIITKPTLSYFAEDGPEAAIPLDGSERSKMLWKQAGELLGMYQKRDTQTTLALKAEKMLNADDTQQPAKSKDVQERGSAVITYSPNIIIKGNASKEDVIEANTIAQEKFEQMIEKYFRNKARVAF